MDKQTTLLFEAIYQGNLEATEKVLENGADVNGVNDCAETPLVAAISTNNIKGQQNLVKLLINKGADPNFRGEENCGVLFQAVLLKDPIIMEIVLDAGANPNFLMETNESLYDWAEFDYRYDAFNLSLPFEPTDEDQASEEAWLNYLEKCADAKQVFRPDFLRILRAHGAMTSAELQNK